jgi:hypothetical protein
VIDKLEQPLIISDEVIQMMKFNPEKLIHRQPELIVSTMSALFELANHFAVPIRIRQGDTLLNKIELVRNVSQHTHSHHVVVGPELIVAAEGQVSMTPLTSPGDPWIFEAIGSLAPFWLQNQAKSFQGLSTGAYVLSHALSCRMRSEN